MWGYVGSVFVLWPLDSLVLHEPKALCMPSFRGLCRFLSGVLGHSGCLGTRQHGCDCPPACVSGSVAGVISSPGICAKLFVSVGPVSLSAWSAYV